MNSINFMQKINAIETRLNQLLSSSESAGEEILSSVFEFASLELNAREFRRIVVGNLESHFSSIKLKTSKLQFKVFLFILKLLRVF